MKLAGASIAVVVQLIGLSCSAVLADVVWDQRQDPSHYYGWTSLSYVPLQGQEFVPDLDRIDILHLWIEDHNIEEVGDANFTVRLREASISGFVVAESWVLNLPEGFHGVAPFIFGNVELVPGEKYVFEIVIEPFGAPGNWGVGYTASQPASEDYARGSRIRNGVVSNVQDLWFREGIFQTVSIEKGTWGSVKAIYR